MPNKVAILGLGWLGEPLAVALHKQGYEVSGTTTRTEQLKHLVAYPFYVGKVQVQADQIVGDWETFIEEASHLIINIPPRRVPDIETVYPAQMEQIISRTPKSTKVIFVGSTAVYGHGEQPFTEADTTEPVKASGHAVLKAEKLLKAAFGENLTVLRLAGLIGPDRHPGKFLAGKRALKNPNVPVNLIHQADCIGLIEAILKQDFFGEVLNGCATEHPVREAYYKKAAEILQLEAPVFEADSKTSSKIIDNTKSKEVLKYTYQYDHPEEIFTKNRDAAISIVGAGPGAYELLTLRGFHLLEEADAILHDNLVSPEILNINTKAEHIYVGRKYGDASNQQDRQDRINELLKAHYQQGKKVVRLKSGDPYIFGRAAEEARYLVKENLPFEVVPGISAALAAANRSNIPITERRQSNAILICTAHTADYSTAQLQGIAEMLRAGNTLALYMGLKSLDKIIPKLLEVCHDPSIPINAVSNVSRSNEVLLASTLGNIEEDVIKHKLEMPVVFIIGVEPIQ